MGPLSRNDSRPENAWHHYVLGLFFAMLALLGLVIALHGPLAPTLERLNVGILRAVHGLWTPAGDRVARWVAAVLEPAVLAVPAGLWAVERWARGERAQAIAIAANLLGAGFLTYGPKDLFHESRPHLFAGSATALGYGFPSGHALFASAVIGFALWRLGLGRSLKARLALVVLGVGVVAVAGFDRIYLGVHWPTDVLGGVLAGGVWLVASCRGYRALSARAHR